MEDSGRSDAITTVSFRVPSCTLSRPDLVELARPVQDVAGEQDWRRPWFVIKGRDRTLTCHSLNAFEDSSWPRDVKEVSLDGEGEDGRKIKFWASTEMEEPQKVEISGQDALWVQGVAQYYRDMLNERRNWHWLANWAAWVPLAPLLGPFWIHRLFPYVEVHSGVRSRAAVLRARAASAIMILLTIGLGVLSAVVYNLLT